MDELRTAAAGPLEVTNHERNDTAEKFEGLLTVLCNQIEQRLQQRQRLRATYRLQIHSQGFDLAAAQQVVDYLHELGVSHLYASPLLKSQQGSLHGYDVVDSTQLNDELGTPEQLQQLIEGLQGHQLDLLLDIVPNHMSVASDQNRWWIDVLKHGAASPYAMFFDIDWFPSKTELHGRVLLPVLGAVSGEVLESGQLQVHYDHGNFHLQCYDYRLPLDPKSCVGLLREGLLEVDPSDSGGLTGGLAVSQTVNPHWIELRSIIAALEYLPARTEDSITKMAERQRESLVIQRRLQALVERAPAIAEHIQSNIRRINGQVGQPRSFDQLDQLLDEQAYRLVHWKASSDEINYRRFFDVTSLAALCVERLHVFEHTHRLILDWASRGWVSALRVDHVDGLFDPTQYLWRVQWYYLLALGRSIYQQLAEDESSSKLVASISWSEIESQLLTHLHQRLGGTNPQRYLKPELPDRDEPPLSLNHRPHVAFSGRLPLPIYVEKILGAEEPLPEEWPVLGTTGYDFLNTLNGLFIDATGFQKLVKHYARYTLEPQNFEEIVYQCKRLILSGPMRSEVTLLATRLDRLAHRSRYWRDFTLNALEFALQETIACFMVYRTYIRDSLVSARDAQVIQRAVAMAKRRNPAVETDAFDFLRDVLLLTEPRDLSDDGWRDRADLVGRFQQVTSPVQAKGVEDTAFYRYIPLLSIDEVGGEPRHAVKSLGEYHRQNELRLEQWPLSMLATTTHDTKRSEDVRARLNVLSEVPSLWRQALQRWQRLNRKHVRQVDGLDAPSRNDQWLLYQTLVGIWPVSPPDLAQRAVLIQRVIQYMEKATKEAKLHTSWISPNPAYDAALTHFIETVLSDPGARFCQELQEFVDSILDAGLINGVAQVALKLAAPGVADIYQGQELWDFSLVDPDNRRAVDYDLRRHLLSELRGQTQAAASRQQFARYLADHPRDNRLKLWVTLEGLSLRQRLGAHCTGRSHSKRILQPDRFQNDWCYLPLEVQGPRHNHVIAHAWMCNHDTDPPWAAIVAVPRFVQSIGCPFTQIDWQDTQLVLPADWGEMQHRFTGTSVHATYRLPVQELLGQFPVAILYADV